MYMYCCGEVNIQECTMGSTKLLAALFLHSAGTPPVQKYTSMGTEVTNCISMSTSATTPQLSSPDEDQGLELHVASEGEWLPDSTIPQSQEQEANTKPSPPPRTKHGSLPENKVQLRSLSVEQKQQVVEAVLKDDEMKAQVLSSLQPELLRSLGTSLGGKHSPLHSWSEGDLSHRHFGQAVSTRDHSLSLSLTTEHGKPPVTIGARQSPDESSLSSAASGVGSAFGSVNIGNPPPVQQQSSTDSKECSSTSVCSSTCQLTSQSSVGSEDCYDVG